VIAIDKKTEQSGFLATFFIAKRASITSVFVAVKTYFRSKSKQGVQT